SPRAETSRLPFPSLRLCIFVLLVGARAGLILPVVDLFHPLDRLAVEPFHDGDVSHGRARRGAVPMLLARRTPDDVTGANPLDRASPALHQTAAGRDDQRLPQRMRVPRRSGAGLERDADAE